MLAITGFFPNIKRQVVVSNFWFYLSESNRKRDVVNVNGFGKEVVLTETM